MDIGKYINCGGGENENKTIHVPAQLHQSRIISVSFPTVQVPTRDNPACCESTTPAGPNQGNGLVYVS